MSESENTEHINLEPGKKPVPVVAIGGSAGGQQAIGELLLHLPATTGLAFVYIQHLAADYDSKLDVILSTKTSMPVLVAAHLMPVEPNHLYVIPPAKTMEVIDGVLVLMPREPKPHPHLPIDQFFISLAERQKDGAIGIILSGMANDGTLGLKAIKVAGGITFAQDETAAYHSMPLAAITEGVVDMVLSPKEIAIELLRLSDHADIFKLTAETSSASQDDSDKEDLKKILAFVRSSSGVDFTHYKKTTITRRIIRRMLLYKLETFSDYISYLKKHPAEAGILYSDLLINVTTFFRDTPAMLYLKEQVLPRIIKNRASGEAVRIWVAGCSTGQEAYSLGMMMLEELGQNAASVPVQIFATDLSDNAIARARLGMYSKSEVADVSPERLERFFSKADEQYRVNKLVRDLCVFAPHNLLSDPPFSRMDLISCRNLLIYLDEELQKKVFATFHYALKAEGYLFLGKSESVGGSPSYFTQIEKAQKVFARKNNAQTKIPLDMAFKNNTPTPQFKTITAKTTDLVSVSELDKLVDNLLLSTYVPPSVVVDQDLEIIQFRGSTGPFLQHQPGKASLNLTKMAHPSLVFELRNIVHKARKSATPAKKYGLEISYLDKPVYVNIEAVPITNPDNQQLFLVIFEQLPENAFPSGSLSGEAGQRNQLLEAELTALRQDMHSIVEEQEASNEELQSANEEIVSSNEELQSINEELETSKEEIESANEELQTINQELQVRNDQLTESYEYAEAIFSTVNEPTLVLDEYLRVKSANNAFYRFFSTQPSQTEGQLIYELSDRQLDFMEFRELIHQVATHNAAVKGLETDIRITASEIRTIVIHARKLTLHQKQIILLGFEDITGYRKEQQLLKQRQEWFEELVDSAPALIWVCGADGKINFLNKAWVEFTGQAYRKNEDTFTGAIHPEDLKLYQDTFVSNLGKQTEFSQEYRLKRSDGSFRWVLENAKPMFSADGKFTGYTGSSMDIHLQKTLAQQLNLHVDEKTAELKDANQQLIKTADRLQSVLNGVPASVTLMQPVYTADGTIADFSTSVFNNKALELTGQNSEQILSKTLIGLNPRIQETGLLDLYIQVLQTGQPAYREFTGLVSEKQTLAFLITRQIDQTGIVVTILDISARKDAEIKLTEVAESLQVVLDSSPASIAFFKAVYDQDGQLSDFTLVVCNQKFSSEFKKPDSELIGMLAGGLFPDAYQQHMKQTFLTKKPFYLEHLLDGHPKWVATSMTRHDHGIAVTELDITQLKQAGFQQQNLIEQLQGSSEMVESLAVMKEYVQSRGAFLRSSFHDLRGSFGIIVGAATLLNIMDSEKEREKVLDMIQRNLAGVSHMMNQLLDYSRLESGEEKFQNGTFDAGTLLSELCEGFTHLARQKKLYFQYNGPASLPVEGDQVKVHRIAQNLVLNALKYTSHGGVTVSWQTVDAHDQKSTFWEFEVKDTGPGIPERLVSKLNDLPVESENGNVPDQQNSADGAGEGIGLFIVKRLCELLKGKVHVSYGDEEGTTFRIVIPMSYRHEPGTE
jgi:two-component system CheB/CheR fusion protein